MENLNAIGASVSLLMGLGGLLAPKLAERIVGLKPVTKPGQSEFRATFGGLFFMLGGLPLLSGEPLMYALAGAAWVGAALGRILSIAVDRAGNALNAGAVLFELSVGALLLVGAPFAALRAILAY